MNKLYQKSSRNILVALLMLASFGCKKTEEIAPDPLPDNRLTQYSVVNVTGDPIKGIINHEDKTVTVYLPYYLGLTTIEVAAKVSEGATLANNEILLTDVLSIVKGTKKVSYSVTGKSGAKADYSLKIEVQQPDFEMLEISASEESPVNFNVAIQGFTFIRVVYAARKGPIMNTAVSKVVLIAQDGKEFIIPATNTIFGANWVDTTVPANFKELSSGLYRVRVDSYAKSYNLKNSIRLTVTQ